MQYVAPAINNNLHSRLGKKFLKLEKGYGSASMIDFNTKIMSYCQVIFLK